MLHVILSPAPPLRYGRLGHGGSDDVDCPRRVTGFPDGTKIVSVSTGVGDAHTLAVTSDGEVWSWGDGGSGKLGNGDTDRCRRPKKINHAFDGTPVLEAHCGLESSLVLTSGGKVFTWGSPSNWKLGFRDPASPDAHVMFPSIVEVLRPFHVVRVGFAFSQAVAVTNRGKFWYWGQADKGPTCSPKEIPGLSGKGIAHIAVGVRYVVAMTGSFGSAIQGNFKPVPTPELFDVAGRLLDRLVPLLGGNLRADFALNATEQVVRLLEAAMQRLPREAAAGDARGTRRIGEHLLYLIGQLAAGDGMFTVKSIALSCLMRGWHVFQPQGHERKEVIDMLMSMVIELGTSGQSDRVTIGRQLLRTACKDFLMPEERIDILLGIYKSIMLESAPITHFIRRLFTKSLVEDGFVNMFVARVFTLPKPTTPDTAPTNTDDGDQPMATAAPGTSAPPVSPDSPGGPLESSPTLQTCDELAPRFVKGLLEVHTAKCLQTLELVSSVAPAKATKGRTVSSGPDEREVTVDTGDGSLGFGVIRQLLDPEVLHGGTVVTGAQFIIAGPHSFAGAPGVPCTVDGLHNGDIILAINGVDCAGRTLTELHLQLDAIEKSQDRVKLTVRSVTEPGSAVHEDEVAEIGTVAVVPANTLAAETSGASPSNDSDGRMAASDEDGVDDVQAAERDPAHGSDLRSASSPPDQSGPLAFDWGLAKQYQAGLLRNVAASAEAALPANATAIFLDYHASLMEKCEAILSATREALDRTNPGVSTDVTLAALDSSAVGVLLPEWIHGVLLLIKPQPPKKASILHTVAQSFSRLLGNLNSIVMRLPGLVEASDFALAEPGPPQTPLPEPRTRFYMDLEVALAVACGTWNNTQVGDLEPTPLEASMDHVLDCAIFHSGLRQSQADAAAGSIEEEYLADSDAAVPARPRVPAVLAGFKRLLSHHPAKGNVELSSHFSQEHPTGDILFPAFMCIVMHANLLQPAADWMAEDAVTSSGGHVVTSGVDDTAKCVILEAVRALQGSQIVLLKLHQEAAATSYAHMQPRVFRFCKFVMQNFNVANRTASDCDASWMADMAQSFTNSALAYAKAPFSDLKLLSICVLRREHRMHIRFQAVMRCMILLSQPQPISVKFELNCALNGLRAPLVGRGTDRCAFTSSAIRTEGGGFQSEFLSCFDEMCILQLRAIKDIAFSVAQQLRYSDTHERIASLRTQSYLLLSTLWLFFGEFQPRAVGFLISSGILTLLKAVAMVFSRVEVEAQCEITGPDDPLISSEQAEDNVGVDFAVSSNPDAIGALIDMDSATYWTSDGQAGRHWVRVWNVPNRSSGFDSKMKSIEFLLLPGNSYHPTGITVSGAKDHSGEFKEFAEIAIANDQKTCVIAHPDIQKYKVIQATFSSRGINIRLAGIKTKTSRIPIRKNIAHEICKCTARLRELMMVSAAKHYVTMKPHALDVIAANLCETLTAASKQGQPVSEVAAVSGGVVTVRGSIKSPTCRYELHLCSKVMSRGGFGLRLCSEAWINLLMDLVLRQSEIDGHHAVTILKRVLENVGQSPLTTECCTEIVAKLFSLTKRSASDASTGSRRLIFHAVIDLLRTLHAEPIFTGVVHQYMAEKLNALYEDDSQENSDEAFPVLDVLGFVGGKTLLCHQITDPKHGRGQIVSVVSSKNDAAVVEFDSGEVLTCSLHEPAFSAVCGPIPPLACSLLPQGPDFVPFVRLPFYMHAVGRNLDPSELLHQCAIARAVRAIFSDQTCTLHVVMEARKGSQLELRALRMMFRTACSVSPLKSYFSLDEVDATLAALLASTPQSIGALERGDQVYRAVAVSSNEAMAGNLVDGLLHTFWKSDWKEGPHWIRVVMRDRKLIAKLEIVHSVSDKSYQPAKVEVYAGPSTLILDLIATVDVGPQDERTVILGPQSEWFAIIQIKIIKSQQGGADTKIRSVEVECTTAMLSSMPAADGVRPSYLAASSSQVLAALSTANDGAADRRVPFGHHSSFQSNHQVVAWGGGHKGVLDPFLDPMLRHPGAIMAPCTRATVDALAPRDVCVRKEGFLVVASNGVLHKSSNNRMVKQHIGALNPVAADHLHPPLQSLIVSKVSFGGYHTLVLTDAGKLYSMGTGLNGKLGHGDTRDAASFRQIESVASLTLAHIDCGRRHSAAVTSTGQVLTWGYNEHGRLGLGDESDRLQPTLVEGLPAIVAVSCGDKHTLALTDDGHVYGWGYTSAGRTGAAVSRRKQRTPVIVPGVGNATKIIATLKSSAAVTSRGELYVWGSARDYRLGTGSLEDVLSPTILSELSQHFVVDADLGHNFGLAVTRDGLIFGWGSNTQGQLGDDTMGSALKPIPLGALQGFYVNRVTCGPTYAIAWHCEGDMTTDDKTAEASHVRVIPFEPPINGLGRAFDGGDPGDVLAADDRALLDPASTSLPQAGPHLTDAVLVLSCREVVRRFLAVGADLNHLGVDPGVILLGLVNLVKVAEFSPNSATEAVPLVSALRSLCRDVNLSNCLLDFCSTELTRRDRRLGQNISTMASETVVVEWETSHFMLESVINGGVFHLNSSAEKMLRLAFLIAVSWARSTLQCHQRRLAILLRNLLLRWDADVMQTFKQRFQDGDFTVFAAPITVPEDDSSDVEEPVYDSESEEENEHQHQPAAPDDATRECGADAGTVARSAPIPTTPIGQLDKLWQATVRYLRHDPATVLNGLQITTLFSELGFTGFQADVFAWLHRDDKDSTTTPGPDLETVRQYWLEHRCNWPSNGNVGSIVSRTLVCQSAMAGFGDTLTAALLSQHSYESPQVRVGAQLQFSPYCRALVAIGIAVGLKLDPKGELWFSVLRTGSELLQSLSQRTNFPGDFRKQLEAELGARHIADEASRTPAFAPLDNASVSPAIDWAVVDWYASRPGDFRLPPSRSVPALAKKIVFEGHPASGVASHLRFANQHRTVALRDDCLEGNTWVCGDTLLSDGVFYWAIRMDARGSMVKYVGIGVGKAMETYPRAAVRLLSDGTIRSSQESKAALTVFGENDVVGIFINTLTGKISFDVNGVLVGDIIFPGLVPGDAVQPLVYMFSPGDRFTFLHDIPVPDCYAPPAPVIFRKRSQTRLRIRAAPHPGAATVFSDDSSSNSTVRASGYVSNADGVWLKLASPGPWGEADAFLLQYDPSDGQSMLELVEADSVTASLALNGSAPESFVHLAEIDGSGASPPVALQSLSAPTTTALASPGDRADMLTAGAPTSHPRAPVTFSVAAHVLNAYAGPDTATINVGVLQQNQEITVSTELQNIDGTLWCRLTKPCQEVTCDSNLKHLEAWVLKAQHGTVFLHSEPAVAPAAYPVLADMGIQPLRLRLFALQMVTQAVLPLAPYLELASSPVGDWPCWELAFGESVSNRRSLSRELLRSHRELLFRRAINKTGCTGTRPTITLDRVHQVNTSLRGAERNRSVFEQAAAQLLGAPVETFLASSRVWRVNFVGEGVDDAGGGYSESVSEMSSELQQEAVGLLLPTPNGRVDVGENRGCFILNPAGTTPADLRHFRFLGILIGVAIRTKGPIDLPLAPPMWRMLSGLRLDVAGIDELDRNMVAAWKCIAEVSDPALLAEMAFETAVPSSDGKTLHTVLGEPFVTADNRQEYLARSQGIRMSEFDLQIAAVREGMAQVVPVPLLAMFTGADLETMVCGSPDFSVETLRAITRYKGIAEGSDLAQWFWAVLAEFTATERSLFLRFIWGRTRLPRELTDTQQFSLTVDDRHKSQADADGALPGGRTCFFQLIIPRYSCRAALAKKLKYAIVACRSIDTDAYAR